MLCIFPTASKLAPIIIVCFMLKILKNEQCTCNVMRFDEYGALEKSTYITCLLVDEITIDLETTGGDVSWLNEKKNITTQVYTTWLKQPYLTAINVKTNFAVQLKHPLKPI